MRKYCLEKDIMQQDKAAAKEIVRENETVIREFQEKKVFSVERMVE